ncbi:hypothetical protein CLH39_01925 [Alcaligenes faecalis]|uniref:glycosyltransferase family 4 protein n=1 Tax=Alcaligenes faecalis TaxID=511 RepID=UPI0019311A56|nr:glycosyltransferase family 4 protein [Alcaligenes faecalis]QRF89065.1 hypothetical protein CLH39_01925 [Alcaligenes faecalis]
MKILVVAPDFPYPPNHGGRVDIWERIKKLHAFGAQVDLVYTSYEDERAEHLAEVLRFVGQIIPVKRLKDVFYLFGLRPYQVASRKNLMEVQLQQQYDYIILESEYVIDFALNDTGSAKLALRVHNDEVSYYQALCNSSKSITKKMYYYLEAQLFKRNKKEYFKRVDFALYISPEEMEKNAARNYGQAYYYPPDLSFTNFKTTRPENQRVLFVGNLFTANNIDGLLWYIEHVHDKVAAQFPEYELVVAGNTKGKNIQHVLNKARIIFYDSPANLDEIYAQAAVFINPMLSGAGVKLKTLNAVAEGLPVVSTTVGTEGTGLNHEQHCLIANTAESFAHHVGALLENPQLGSHLTAQAQDFLRQNFDNAKRFQTIFKH